MESQIVRPRRTQQPLPLAPGKSPMAPDPMLQSLREIAEAAEQSTSQPNPRRMAIIIRAAARLPQGQAFIEGMTDEDQVILATATHSERKRFLAHLRMWMSGDNRIKTFPKVGHTKLSSAPERSPEEERCGRQPGHPTIRVPRKRPRLEFFSLEVQLKPEVFEQARRQFFEAILEGKVPEKPVDEIQDQFRLLEKINTRRARRERYQAKRRQKKLDRVISQMRPEILMGALWMGMGMVPGIDAKQMAQLLAGASGTDARLTRKFFREMEVVYETMSPAIPPHLIDRERATQEAASSARIVYDQRIAFESLLVPIEIPRGGEAVHAQTTATNNQAAQEEERAAAA